MVASIRRWLPRGNTLPDEHWARRHRGIVALLWAHAAVIPIYGLVRGVNLTHVAVESLIVPTAAVYASWPRLSRRLRTLAASVGLLSASAVLVHFSGGLIEMHFHFFVMVAVVSLYQDWLPFLAASATSSCITPCSARSIPDPCSTTSPPWTTHGDGQVSTRCSSPASASPASSRGASTRRLLDQRRDAEDRLREETADRRDAAPHWPHVACRARPARGAAARHRRRDSR